MSKFSKNGGFKEEDIDRWVKDFYECTGCRRCATAAAASHRLFTGSAIVDLYDLIDQHDLAAFAVGFEGDCWCYLIMIRGLQSDLEIRSARLYSYAELSQTIKDFVKANR